jgi:hypothetical protein
MPERRHGGAHQCREGTHHVDKGTQVRKSMTMLAASMRTPTTKCKKQRNSDAEKVLHFALDRSLG